MRKKVIILSIVVFMLSFLPAYISGISTPDTAAGGNAGHTISPARNNDPALISPSAKPIRNLWGAASGERVELALHHSDNAVSWKWSRQKPAHRRGIDYVQPIYPNARINLKSQVAVGDIQSFNLFADFHYIQPPTGGYNLAYDVFLREPGTKAEKAEIMVVLDRTQPHPTPPLEGSYSDGYSTYKLYSGTRTDGCAFRSFQMQLPPTTTPYQVNLKALIDLVNPEKTWYISEVELGTEVWNGSGAMELTTYYLELNGARL